MPPHGKAASKRIDAYDLLPPDPVQRRRLHTQSVRPLAVEDAVFEVIPAKSRTHWQSNDNAYSGSIRYQERNGPPVSRILAWCVARVEAHLSKLSPQAFLSLVCAMCFLVFWACDGFGNLSGSSIAAGSGAPFEIVETSIVSEDANGMRIASVVGAIANVSETTRAAPVLSVVSGPNRLLLGRISPAQTQVSAGETVRFSGRFKLDGGKSSDISIIASMR